MYGKNDKNTPLNIPMMVTSLNEKMWVVFLEMIKQPQRSKNELSIEIGPYKITQDQDLTNTKKSTSFELSSWNLV